MRALVFALMLGVASAQNLPVSGIAHLGVRVSDLVKARSFYTDWLGFEVAFELHDNAGQVTALHFKINDEQFLEIYPGLDPADEMRRTHIAFLSSNVGEVRRLLVERGLAPGGIVKNASGNLDFSLSTPEGTLLKFVQYLPDSLQSHDKGKHLGARRLATRLRHAGMIVADLEPSLKFYTEKLGFTEFWRGGIQPGVLRWITFRIPDTGGAWGDYVEFMIEPTPPNRRQRGAMEHAGLEVADINAARKELLARGMPDERPRNPILGLDRHWLLNLLDPDGTRMELMESRTIPPDAGP